MAGTRTRAAPRASRPGGGGAARTRRGGPERRRRLGPAERERQIVDGAIAFFAERGFDGQTRELAARLRITQPLLYRYFPSKQRLVDRVYREVFVGRWDPRWDALLAEASVPLRERLVAVYGAYLRAIFHSQWVRIFMFAGLRGFDINRRYLAIVRARLFVPICRALRAEQGLPPLEAVPLTEGEVEACWRMHGGFYYMAVRRWIYRMPLPRELDAAIAQGVDVFLGGAPPVLRACVLAAPAARQARRRAQGQPDEAAPERAGEEAGSARRRAEAKPKHRSPGGQEVPSPKAEGTEGPPVRKEE